MVALVRGTQLSFVHGMTTAKREQRAVRSFQASQGAACSERRPHRPAEEPGTDAGVHRRDYDRRLASVEAFDVAGVGSAVPAKKQNARRENDSASSPVSGKRLVPTASY